MTRRPRGGARCRGAAAPEGPRGVRRPPPGPARPRPGPHPPASSFARPAVFLLRPSAGTGARTLCDGAGPARARGRRPPTTHVGAGRAPCAARGRALGTDGGRGRTSSPGRRAGPGLAPPSVSSPPPPSLGVRSRRWTPGPERAEGRRARGRSRAGRPATTPSPGGASAPSETTQERCTGPLSPLPTPRAPPPPRLRSGPLLFWAPGPAHVRWERPPSLRGGCGTRKVVASVDGRGGLASSPDCFAPVSPANDPERARNLVTVTTRLGATTTTL